MRLHLLHWRFAAVITVALGVTAQGQTSGIRANSYKPSTPFADLGRHSRDSSPLGIVDGSVNQSIGLQAEGQFTADQPRSAGLDQLQPSPHGGGQRSALASTGGFSTGAGAPKYIPSQAFTRPMSEAYSRPSYLASPRSTSDGVTDLSRLAASRQSGQTGTPVSSGRSSALQAGSTRGGKFGGTGSAGRAGGYAKAISTMQGNARANGAAAVTVNMPATSAAEAEPSPFEKLGDPFRTASTTGFESFETRSAFDRPCGDACTFRSGGGGPFSVSGRGSRERNPLGEAPPTRVPDRDTKVQTGEGLKLP